MSLHTYDIAPDTPYHSAKFQFNTTPLSKVILTHVNSTYTPIGLKHTPANSTLAIPSTPPYIHVYKTLPKSIDY